MARVRLTLEALAHLLDLPEGHEVEGMNMLQLDDGTRLVELWLGGESEQIPVAGDFALQYEQGADGSVHLVDVLPVDE